MTTLDAVPGQQVDLDFAQRFGGEFVAAWNSHDPERLVALADPVVRWEDPYIAGGRLEGHDALRA